MGAVATATYKEWLEYRSHMAVSLFVGPVFFVVQYFIWNAVFSGLASAGVSTVRGFTLNQMLTYFGIAAVINYLIFDSADWNLQMLIHIGKFTTFLLRPISHLLYALAQKIGHRILGLIIEFIPIVALFSLVFRINLVPQNLFWALLSVSLSFLLFFLVNYCVGLSAFWLTKTNGIRRMFMLLRDICAGSFLPLLFFPDFLQNILFFLPFQFISYVPIRVFIGSYQLAGRSFSIPEIVGLQAVMVVVVFGLTRLLWRSGIRKFTGVGG